MELGANVWRVIDEGTGMVSRFMMRTFEIPNQFKAASLHDNVEGMVPIVGFHENLQQMLEQACRALKENYAKLQGINWSSG